MAKGNFWRMMRIMILLYVLLFVAAGAWLARATTTDWDETLYVGIYPLNGDGSTVSADYIQALDERTFRGVERFMQRESARYGITIDSPVRIEVGEPVDDRPPAPPADRNVLKVMTWSLSLRYWAWRMQGRQPGPRPDVRIFVAYHDPQTNRALAHSLGLEKGLIGVVNGFAARRLAGGNNVVIAHELLHTLGASDKYDPGTSLPLFPAGYAEPDRAPLHPQRRAEIMGGRTPLSATEAVTPENLDEVVVGPATAVEIRWTR